MIIKTKILISVKRLFFVSLLLLFFISAQSQREFFIPKALIIPVHTHKQELHVSLGLGGGYDGNISYALTKHFAVFTTGNLNTGTAKRVSFFGDKFKIHKNDYAVKGGIGYYSATKHKLVNYIESYAGYGKYKVDNFWYFPDEKETSGYDTKARFWNVFWQINATHKIHKQEFTTALRITYSKYTDLQYRDRYPNAHDLKNTLEGLRGVTIDPVVSYSYLLNKCKFNLQAGVAVFLNSVKVDVVHYQMYANQIIVSKDPGITKVSAGAAIGRLSVEYNFDFRKKNKRG